MSLNCTNWSICLTNRNHEFFASSDPNGAPSSWDVPDEILDIVGELLNDAMLLETGGAVPEDVDRVVDDVLEEALLLGKRPADVIIPEDRDIGDDNYEPAEKKIKHVDIPLPKSFKELERDFFCLLEDRRVSPFSTWAIEREKFENDPRAQAMNEADRKDLFDKWSTETAQKQLEEKKILDQNPRAVFEKLLTEQVKNIRGARFDDFSRRFKNDSRFLKVVNLKERQELFDAHLAKLKEEMRSKARAEFDEMLVEHASGCRTVDAVVSLVKNEARYLAVKNATERENRVKLFISKRG